MNILYAASQISVNYIVDNTLEWVDNYCRAKAEKKLNRLTQKIFEECLVTFRMMNPRAFEVSSSAIPPLKNNFKREFYAYFLEKISVEIADRSDTFGESSEMIMLTQKVTKAFFKERLGIQPAPDFTRPVIDYTSFLEDGLLFVRLKKGQAERYLEDSSLKAHPSLAMATETTLSENTFRTVREKNAEIFVDKASFCKLLLRLIDCQKRENGFDLNFMDELYLEAKPDDLLEEALSILEKNLGEFTDWNIAQVSVKMLELLNPPLPLSSARK